jgi:PAS domain S-box-containing protein
MRHAAAADLLQAFVDSLDNFAVVLLDVDGNIVSWNAGAQRLLGYEPREVIGRNFSFLYTETDQSRSMPRESLDQALARDRFEEVGKRLHKNGAEFDAHCLLAPLRDPQRRLVGWSFVLRQGLGKGAPIAAVDNKTILVVDDDDQVRDLTLRELGRLGYRVLAASSGRSALDILASDSDVDLLVTDVVMPGGMSGGELAAEARLHRPNLKVLFMSGYFEEALVRNRHLAPGARVLVKPFRRVDLATRVAEALNSSSTAL